jgi:hypothetical protein
MKQNILILTFIIFFLGLIKAQILPCDSVRFIRFIDSTENNVSIPITDLYYLNNIGFKNKSGWIFDSSLQVDSLHDLFLVEMYPSEVPYGPWTDFAQEPFQLAFEIDKGTQKITLDTINSKIHLINDYATRGENSPTNTINGTLEFKKVQDKKVIINGTISIISANPATKHEIVFKNTLQFTTDYSWYCILEKNSQKQRDFKEKKENDIIKKISIAETKFFDSIFNYELYPNNNLKANIDEYLEFDFELDRSYVVEGADISEVPSSSLLDLLSSDIYYPIHGNLTVINFHYFSDGENIMDNQTNYSLLIALPELAVKDYLINKNSTIKSKLAYWHYGPEGHIIESKSALGNIRIIKIENQTIWGNLKIEFKTTDKKIFKLSGDFQLPLVDKEAFNKLAQEIKKIINE